MNSFFRQTVVANEGPKITGERKSRSPCGKDRESAPSTNTSEIKSRSRSGSPAPLTAQVSEYERLFPPFFVQSHTTIAPQNRFSRDEGSLQYARSRIDEGFGSASGTEVGSSAPIFDPFTLFHLPQQHRGDIFNRLRMSLKEVVENIHGTVQKPIDLTESGSKSSLRKPTDLLKCFTIKYLKFAEDVRPPYIGTYTKICDHSTSSKLSRNPFARSLPATDYNYDSEAEWEEPGEGEDLDSEGEEEVGEDEDDDEMEGFLDDEEGIEIGRMVNLKHRHLNGDLEPSCTGLCWESASDQEGLSSGEAKLTIDLKSFRMNILSGK